MATQSNVIELVFKLKDQVSAPLAALRSKLGGALAFGAGLAGVTGLAGATMKIISATREAQDALTKFDLAFKNLGATSGKTREELLRFAQDASKNTIFDDESILRAQAALLKFRSVSGATFDRARQAAIDLASAIGTDIESAAETVGRALQRPEVGIRQLRAAGILFTADQEKMIRALVKTGDTATAAEIVLSRLEKQFKGAGDAASKTLSGALARTKTAFDNLFEGSEEDTRKLTEAVDSLADTLNSPEVKAGMAIIVAGIAQMVSWALKAVAAFGRMGKAIADAVVSPNAPSALENLRGELAKMQIIVREAERSGVNTGIGSIAEQKAYIETLKQRIAILKEAESIGKSRTNRRGGDRGAGVSELDPSVITEGMAEIEEAAVKAFVEPKSAMEAFYDSLNERTMTSAETAGQAFERIRAELDELFEAGRITAEQYNKRLREAAEEGLEEVKVTIQKDIIPAIKSPFDKLIDSVSSALERMLNNGKFTFRELGAYLLRELSSGLLKKALDALSRALKDALSGVNFGSGFFGQALGAIGSLFGGNAGGGLVTPGGGPRWVGENGRELLVPTSSTRVYNQRQLSAMGFGRGGANVTIGGTSIQVGGDVSERNMALIREYVDVANARQARLFAQMLQTNGLRGLVM